MSEPVYDQQDADNYYLATDNRVLRANLMEAASDVARLREALKRYGHHRWWCRIIVGLTCNCGFEAALKP